MSHCAVGTYSEVLFGGKDLTKSLASTNSQCVSQKTDLLDILLSTELCNVRFEVGGGVEL